MINIVTINGRCTQILSMLLNSDEPITINDLSQKLNVSSRTVRYNLDEVDGFLVDNGLKPLNRKPNVGITLVQNSDEKQELTELMKKLNVYYIILSQEERVNFILNELIGEQNFVTIDSIAEKLFVSRNTIIKDLASVRKWLKKNNLTVESAPKHGIRIVGEERYLRRAEIALLAGDNSMTNFFSKMVNKPSINIESNSPLEVFFKQMDMEYIEKCVNVAEKELDAVFSDEAFAGLTIHIAIAIKRIQLNKDIFMDEDELKSLEITKEFTVASNIAKMLEERFNVAIPIGEIGYISIHLLGSNHTSSKITENKDWVELQILTNDIIQDVGSIIGQDLTSDNQLFRGIIEHLKPAIYRLNNDLTLKNPLLQEIKSSYRELFEAVKKGLKPVEDFTGKELSDEEVGYFAMHFGAALQRFNDNDTIKQNVLVVCATGIGTAEMLSSRIQSVFNVNIVGTVPIHQVKDVLNENKVDLIITTVPIGSIGVTCIEVSPLLNEKDIANLNHYIKRQGRAEPAGKMNSVLDTIKKHCRIMDYEGLVNDLSKILNVSNFIEAKGVKQPVLKDLLNEKTIKLNVEVKTWEDAVIAGGELLEKNGSVEHRYIESMIKTVKEIGPYIVIGPGIAMPHARPEAGAKKIGMSLITLSNPVNFGNKENDPVDIVVCLCAVDHISHIKALSELVGLMGDDEKVKRIRSAEDVSSVQKIISDSNSVDNQN